MKLKDWAIEILMADLGASCQSSMLAIYLMATGGDMSENVTKLDLTKIIFVLCKQLDWVADNGSCTEFEPDVDQSSTKSPVGNGQFPSDDDITCGSNVKLPKDFCLVCVVAASNKSLRAAFLGSGSSCKDCLVSC